MFSLASICLKRLVPFSCSLKTRFSESEFTTPLGGARGRQRLQLNQEAKRSLSDNWRQLCLTNLLTLIDNTSFIICCFYNLHFNDQSVLSKYILRISRLQFSWEFQLLAILNEYSKLLIITDEFSLVFLQKKKLTLRAACNFACENLMEI